MPKTYSEKLRDPRWQKKRLEILERDGWSCQLCYSEKETLQVHHKRYHKGDPWEAPSGDLISLCEPCHAKVEELKKNLGEMVSSDRFFNGLSAVYSLLTNPATLDKSPFIFELMDRREPFFAACSSMRDLALEMFGVGYSRSKQ